MISYSAGVTYCSQHLNQPAAEYETFLSLQYVAREGGRVPTREVCTVVPRLVEVLVSK
jgi:hypothetical protein